MYGEFYFRVVIKKLEEAVINVSNILRENGFVINDLRESNIVMDSDGSLVESIYILCCVGDEKDYENFKSKNKYDEIQHEGFKTLI